MKDQTFHRLLRELKPFLRPYIEEHGVNIDERSFMCCINKDHEDKTPSMHFVPGTDESLLHCFGCLPPTEEVMTPKGTMPIGDLKLSDQIYDVAGNIANVIKIQKKKSQYPIYTVKTETDWLGVKATGDHDMLWCPKPTRQTGQFLLTNARRVNKLYEVELRHLPKDAWLPTAIPQGRHFHDWEMPDYNAPICRRQKTIPLNIHTAYLLGLYSAEGSLSGNRSIHLNVHIDELDDRLKSLEWVLQYFTIKPTIHKKNNAATIVLSHTGLTKWINIVVGTICDNKKYAHECVHNEDIDITQAWLRGLYEGDGHKNRDHINLTSKSLSTGIYISLLRLGAIPRRLPVQKQENKKNVYPVSILHNTLTHALSENAGPIERIHRSFVCTKIQENWTLLTPLREVADNERDKGQTVVDITTSTHTFCCPTLAVHNCGATYNIFHAANALDNLDNRGTGFIKEMIPFLAKKYRIEFDADDLKLSEEAVVTYRYRQLYRDAFEVLKEIGTYEHTQARGWHKELCQPQGVASVNWDEFEKRLCNRGNYGTEEIQSKDIHRRLFAHHLITFTIFDEKGRPSGFVSRNTDYEEGNKATYPKYRNTSNDVPIYSKSKILYGLQGSVMHPERRLDIFEGYADWVTAQHYDHPCCAAMGGVALTLDHLELVKSIGFSHINLIFDGDATGEKRTGGYVDRYAGKIEGLKITVMELPFDDDEFVKNSDKDPDNFFKLKGLKGFMAIEPMTAFDWRLKKRLKEIQRTYLGSGIELEELKENFIRIAADDLKTLVDQIIPMIMADPSPVEQGRMCNRLSKVSGVPEADIRDEVSSRANKQIKEIGELVQRKLRNAGDALEIADILSDGSKRIDNATMSRDVDAYHHIEILEHLDSFFHECDNPTDDITGWRTGWSMLDDPVVLGGIPKKDSILTFAGSPNHGKLLANNTPVLTSEGWKNHGDLRPGDLVHSRDGQYRQVLAIGEPDYADCVITFNDGSQIQCHEDHEWIVFDSSRATKGNSGERIIEAKYLETVKLKKKAGTDFGYRFKVDSQQCLQGYRNKLLIEPYTLGVWLGDGRSTAGDISHATSDQQHIKKIQEYGYKSSFWFHAKTGVQTTSFAGLITKIRKIDLYNNKHIPENYLLSSTDSRLELLAGLIDSDGHVHKTNGRVVFSNCNKTLIDNVGQLVRSLGFRSSISSFEPRDGGAPGGHTIHGRQTTYQLSFTPDMSIPTALPRKLISKGRGTQRKRSIIRIERVAPLTGNCIQVEGGVYLVGKTFIPTHNSAILMNIAKQLVVQENKGLSVLMWYLDDPRNIAWAKMLASMSCESILDTRRPDRNIYNDIERKKRFIDWRNFLRHSVHEKKLLIKGHDIGNDVKSLEYWIKHTQDSTGNDVVVFVDAVHDMITGTQSDNDERIKFSRIYDWVQATTDTMKYSFATCAHITKSGTAKGKPEQSDLSETGKIGFASKVIGMVYSELDYLTSIHRRNDSIMYWMDDTEVDNVDRRKPIVEVCITKNKEAQFKGTMYFKHKSDACFMQPMTSQEVMLIKEANQLAQNEESEHQEHRPTESSTIRKLDVAAAIRNPQQMIEDPTV